MRKIHTTFFLIALLLFGFSSLQAADDNKLVLGYATADLNLNNYPTLTISFWIKPNDPASYGRIIDNDNGGFDRAINTSYTGNFAVWHDSPHDTGIPYINYEWQHVGVVYSAAATKLYVNGTLEWTGAGSSNLSGSTNITLGRDYNGDIDELSFWSKELTEEEIASLMSSSLVGDETDLAAYYNFNDGTFKNVTSGEVDGTGGAIEPNFRLTEIVLSEPTNITAKSFTATWTEPEFGSPEGYILDIDDDADFSTPIVDGLDVGDVLTYDASGLPQVTQLYYRVSAFIGVYNSEYSNVESLTTLGFTRPESLPVSDFASTSFTANWNAVANTDNYFLDVSLNQAFSSFLEGYENLDMGTSTSQAVTGLTPGATYFYRVRANSISDGTSDNSEIIAAYTLVNEPTVSSTLSFSENNNNYGFTVDFDGGDGIGRIVVVKLQTEVDFIPEDYTLYEGSSENFRAAADQGSDNRIVYEGTGNTVTVTDLPSSGTYHVAVYEYNGGEAKNYLTSNVSLGQVVVSGTDLALTETGAAGQKLYLDIMGYKELSVSFSVKTKDDNGSFTLMEPDQGHQYYRLMVSAGLWSFGSNESIPVVEEDWVHVTATYSSTARKLYLNGELAWTQSGVVVPDGLSNSFIYTGYTLSGQMDEVSYWSKELTQEEIQKNLYHSLIGDEENLIAYYNFNDGTFTDLGPSGVNVSGGTYTESYAVVKPVTTGIQTDPEGDFMTWTAPVSQGTDPTSYFLDIDDNSDFSSPLLDNVAVGNVLSYEVPSDLCSSSDYYYRIRGSHETLGSTAYSNVSEFVSTSTTPPVPDLESLPLAKNMSSIDAIEAPTATDQCGGTIVGVADVAFSYTEPGIGEIVWTFTDDFENEATQSQNVFIGEALPNDFCEDAIAISIDQTVTGTYIDALPAFQEFNCFPFEEEEEGMSMGGVWYSFTGTGDVMTVSSSNSDDLFIDVLAGSCNSELICVGSNIFEPHAIFQSELDQEYLVFISAHFEAPPSDSFSITLSSPSTNLLCEEAVTVGLNEPVKGNTLSLIDEGEFEFVLEEMEGGPTVWYHFEGTGDKVQFKTTSGVMSPHNFTIYQGSCDGEIIVNEEEGPEGPGGPGESVEIIVKQDIVTETAIDYFIGVSPVFFSGLFEFEVLEIIPPQNDNCVDAITVNCGDEVAGNTDFANSDALIAPACGSNSDIGNGIWYRFVGTGETINLSTCSDDSFDTSMSVYKGECTTGLVCVAGNEDDPDCQNYSASLTFNSVLNEEYLILVDGYESLVGEFTLNISCEETQTPPANNMCASATSLVVFESGEGTSTTASNKNATAYTGQVSCDEYSNVMDVWFSFNSGYNTSVELTSTLGTAEYLFYALYESCQEEAIQCVSGFDYGFETMDPIHQPEAIFEDLDLNTEYLFQVWNSGAAGDFTLILHDGENSAPTLIGAVSSLDISRYTTSEEILLDLDFSDDEGHEQLFSITQGNDENIFSIDEQTGELYVSDPSALQSTELTQFELEIQLSDQGPGELGDYVNIDLYVQDDLPPVFVNATISADEEVDYQDFDFSYDLQASDPNEFDLTLEIIAGDEDGLFYIDEGTLYVYDYFDFETDAQYELSISASRAGVLGLSTTAIITINVNDLNDKPITYLSENTSTVISLNSANGTLVTQLDAHDQDADQTLTYTREGANEGIFAINADGRITVEDAANLFSAGEQIYQLEYKVSDDGMPVQFETDYHYIVVQGTPMITTFTIAEDAESGDIVGVVDYGGGLNLEYEHTDNDLLDDGTAGIPFYIELDGTITVLDESVLDFNAQMSHQIFIYATDIDTDEQIFWGLPITINLTDANDAPVFDEVSAINVFSSSKNGDEVYQFSASDVDEDDLTFGFADELYEFPIEEIFALNATSGVLTIQDASKIPFGETSVLSVVISVSDGEKEAIVAFDIDLIFNAPPTLSVSSLSIDENSASGTIVGTLTSDDVHGVKHFEILSGNDLNLFSLNESNGVLTFIGDTPFDYETAELYELTIELTDNGPGNLKSVETLTIQVSDVNEAHVLAALSDQEIDEGELLTLAVSVSDVDNEASYIYSLNEEAIDEGMTIDENGTLSWTPGESHGGTSPTVTVTVKDDEHEKSESFVINVVETNQAPELADIGTKSGNELAEITFTATATDVDLPANTLSFSIDEAAVDKGMTINATTGAFSWTPSEMQDGSHELTVTVSDDMLTDSEVVTITVNDVNTGPALSAIGAQRGDELTEITFTASATDVDLPANTLIFSIDVASVEKGMSMDAFTGVFSWTPTDEQGGTHEVTVTVSDGSLSDEEVVTVTVNTSVISALGENTLSSIRLYPNPVIDRFQFTDKSPDEIIIFDMQGKVAVRFSTPQLFYDINQLESGVYSMMMRRKKKITTTRLIKR